MSAEEGSTQPPAASNDKAPAAVAATFSSFINKNTTGKKFAPKAARRRPGATPAATAPKSSVPESAAPIIEPQTSLPESWIATATAHSPAPQLPTPAATQEAVGQDALVIVEPTVESTSSITEGAFTTALTLAPTNSATQVVGAETEEQAVGPQPAPVNRVQPTEDEPETRRAAKRRRLDPQAQRSITDTELEEGATVTEVPSPYTQPEADVSAQQGADTLTNQNEHVMGSSAQGAGTSTTQPTEDQAVAPQPRKRRVLPWLAVNRPRELEEEEQAIPAPAKKTRKPPKPRAKKSAAAPPDTEETELQDGEEDTQVSPVRKRPSAIALGKRKAATAATADNLEAPAPAKRTRRPRKAKSTVTIGDVEVEEGEGEQQSGVEEGPALRKPRKPRQPKRTRVTAAEGDGQGEGGAAPKRKGRPPRAATPSDAEEHTINPEETYMDSLASRNIRVGKLSNLEKQMREVNWAEVRQRQREEDSRQISTKELREAAEKARDAQSPVMELGPQLQHVNGQILVIPSSTVVNREAEADREIANLPIIENKDITSRITSRSFMKNNKRFPNDFLLPGQGRRWTVDDTDLFYQGLRSFGTDFQMISRMFPGSTRRSIKTKFTREEREDPVRVHKSLLGQSQLASHWDEFLHASQMQDESFADTDRIKREMAEAEAEMREKIRVATEETRLRNAQMRAAGVLDDDVQEGTEASNKENGKGKKKKRGKEKQVVFEQEEGVEILPNDDETWGQE
jgi:transcription factor TFIIIB component B''